MGSGKNKNHEKVIRPGRDLNEANASKIKKKLIQCVQQEIPVLIIDFSKVRSLDPVGLSLIISTYNSQKNAGRTVVLKNVSKKNLTLFTTIGLDRHIQII